MLGLAKKFRYFNQILNFKQILICKELTNFNYPLLNINFVYILFDILRFINLYWQPFSNGIILLLTIISWKLPYQKECFAKCWSHYFKNINCKVKVLYIIVQTVNGMKWSFGNRMTVASIVTKNNILIFCIITLETLCII